MTEIRPTLEDPHYLFDRSMSAKDRHRGIELLL